MPPTASAPGAEAGAESFRVTATMKMDGDIDEQALQSAANRQIAKLSGCAVVVRKTDTSAGSMNLHVTVARDGRVTPDLQSPASVEAKRCILTAVAAWVVKGAGAGNAMVLLSIEGGAPPH